MRLCTLCTKQHRITLAEIAAARVAYTKQDRDEIQRWNDHGIITSEVELLHHIHRTHPSKTSKGPCPCAKSS